MNDKLLELEVRLLLLRHGRPRVMQVMARLEQEPIERLEKTVESLEKQRNISITNKRKTVSAVDIIAPLTKDRPDIADLIHLLASQYDNKSFLATMRDVQKFVARLTGMNRTFKSRDLAASTVMNLLITLPKEQLEEIKLSGAKAKESDFSLLSRAIMSPAGRFSENDG